MKLTGAEPGRKLQNHFQNFILNPLNCFLPGYAAACPDRHSIKHAKSENLLINLQFILKAKPRIPVNMWIHTFYIFVALCLFTLNMPLESKIFIKNKSMVTLWF